ncbi:MAG: DUF2905 domain-containing protein [Desulfovibrio sp.]
MFQETGKLIIYIGLAIAALGVLVYFWDKLPFRDLLQKFPLGRLPGDISIDKPGMKVYFPWVTCIVVSIVFSILLNLFKK